ncbi:complex I NDUFA9 subunit family protein [Thermaurantiacus sp.]
MQLVTIVGGSGFVGRVLVERLARRGTRLRIAVRNRARAMRLKPLADVGQIEIRAADLLDPPSLAAAMEGADAAVNLVGILAPSGRYGFDAVQAEGAGAAARAAAGAGVRAYAHVSAIGADPASPSAYGRSKAEGERQVRAAIPHAAILRPSLIFGPDDGFTNRFAGLIAAVPVVPVIAGKTRFQPVYVVDVADAIVAALERQLDGTAPATGETFELGGPEILTMHEINAWLNAETGQNKRLVSVPDSAARLLAGFEFLPGAPLTMDQYRMLKRDNVANPELPGLAALGITPTPLAAVAPQWLDRYRPGGRFAATAAR